MLWRKRYRHRLLIPVAGTLLAIFWLQLTHIFITPSLFNPWFNFADAATGLLDPNGDIGTNTGTRTTCGGTLYFDCLNDVVRDPTAPATGSDFVEYAGGNQTNSDMTTLTAVATATAVAVKVYHQETGTNVTLSATLVNAAGTVIVGPTNLTNRATSQWDTINFTGLGLTQTVLDGLRVRLTCTRAGGAAGSRCRSFAMYTDVTYDPVINVTVATLGTQQNVTAGSANSHVGGAFSIVANVGSRSVTSVTINETGSIDAANNLKNIRLLFDLDTVAPYDCAAETFSGSEGQFGSVVSGGFTGANGSATFSTSTTISPTQTLCLYPVVDVQTAAAPGDVIEVQITTPTTDVVASGSPVITPGSTVAIAGSSVVQKVILEQVNYHWRADDNNEALASSATGGTENTPNTDFPKGVPQRLRVALSNEGNTTTGAEQYRLEYASKVSTCSVATGWTDVGAAAGSFDMAPTVNLTEGSDTTNIAVATGGVSDPNPSFLSPNGGVRDTSSQAGAVTLSSTQFVELEYAIAATSTLSDGSAFCFRVTKAGTVIDTYTRYPELVIGADIAVSTLGTQTATLVASTTNQYVGGAFVITNTTGDTDMLTSISVAATGTAVLSSSVANIVLRYDVDTSAPYNCVSESYSGSDTTFGSSVTAFNGSNKAAFTGVATSTNTRTICVYVVVDVLGTVVNGATLELSLANASTDIVITGTTIAPNAAVNISGTTVLARQLLEQVNYHWRNNDDTESAASSATAGAENTNLFEISKETPYRIRLAISNEGLATSSATAYQLEWAQKTTVCSAATVWSRIDTVSDAWQMASTTNLTDGGNTTNILVATGGVSDPNPTFLTPNSAIKDDTDRTASTTLSPTEFIELEYSVSATLAATQGASYCFRVTNAGTVLDTYTRFPEAKVKLDTDYKIQRGTSILTGTTLTISAGAQYVAPASSTAAFIRITNTQITGGGPVTTGNSSANDVTVYISNPNNLTSSITFTRTSATINTRVSWEIIEYRGAAGGENEMIVHRQEALAYAAGGLTVSGTAISGIASGTKVVAFITGQHNQDAGRNAYSQGLSTSAFSTSTNQVTLTRGESGVISNVSYALVEFTGANWKIKRSEHTFTNVGSTETEAIPVVSSLARTFLHTQKRLTGANINHADFGHEVWLSGIGQVSYLLDAAAASPGNHTSVAWIIENTQSVGARTIVTRSSGLLPTAVAANQSNAVNIGSGKTLTDLSITSLFVNNRSDEASRTWPEPILAVDLISATQYQLWRNNASANLNYRTEVVEWPTAARKLEQNYYRLYVNNNTLTPTDPWPVGAPNLGENAEMTAADDPIAPSEVVRIRMNLKVTSAVLPATLDSFRLQYAERVTTCGAVSSWVDVAPIGSTTAAWRGYNGSSTDGTALSANPPTGGDLLLSISTIAGSYEEENDSALNPYLAFPNDEIEYDWAIQHNLAQDKTAYCFRMTESTGESFTAYNYYPVLRTAGYEPRITNWRWYDDETNLTPTTPLSLSENVAPIDIANQNKIKLRVVLSEHSGATGIDTKFALQFSEYSDFSQAVFPVYASSSCAANSLWCYTNGVGNDNDIIANAVISNAASCVAGVGSGCGTVNEATSTPSTHDHTLLTNVEYEFTIAHAGARANAVYFFRLYDTVNDEYVALSGTSTYPSVVTEGPSLSFDVSGLPSGTSTAGIITNATSTPTTVNFGSIPLNTNWHAAHRIVVTTNATQGYRVLSFARQQLLNTYGTAIAPITGTNAVPTSWAVGCSVAASGCVGYHTTDAILAGGSTRFSPLDSYAGLHTTAAEVMYSPIPATDIHDIVYKVRVGQAQPAGDYQTEMVYLAIPTF